MPPRSALAPPTSGSAQVRGSLVLGIEGGGTRTTAVLADGEDGVLAEFQVGPAVLPLMSDRELEWHLRAIAGRLPGAPQAIGIGLAGVRTEADCDRVIRAAARVWPETPCVVTNDLETALAAGPAPREAARVLVLSGTGSCCFGRNAAGMTAQVGGRGHIIGDRGSACDIGLRALRAVMADLDHTGVMGPLGGAILHALLFAEPEQLIPWSVTAEKGEIAALAVPVFTLAAKGDPLARRLLADAAAMLAEDACACARKLDAENRAVRFVLNGGTLLKNPAFLRDVSRRIRQCWPGAVVSPLKTPSVWGAVKLARERLSAGQARPSTVCALPTGEPALELPPAIADLSILAASPTEQRNARSAKLDRLPISEAIELMLGEDAGLPGAIRAEAGQIEKVVRLVTAAFQAGGRLFYAGAGTSGRLGVLDASEIPPTFRAPREQVQGIIAGGRQALWSAVEGAEDDAQAGMNAIRHRDLDGKDVLIGIAASGRTPFVWGAIRAANLAGAATVLVCFNPAIRTALRKVGEAEWKPRILIAPNLGPEILTGSTRLKAGTATKMILNMITTLAMTRVGKVISNLMVDLNPSNAKLRDRAVRILVELTGQPPEAARQALAASGWVVKEAYRRLKADA